MATRQDSLSLHEGTVPFARVRAYFTSFALQDWERVAYLALFVLAIVTRFWDLGARVMSHDESLHTRFSWNLYQGQGFAHTPLMHGPLLFHMTALNYLLFGDNDFTSRIYTAVVGTIVVMMPLLMRRWLGKAGSVVASFFLLISPMILYYSRYIRHDMPAILGALIIAVSIWRYVENRRFASLVWMAGGQALLFASKEVSFIYIAIFGSFLVLFLITRLLDATWVNRVIYWVFVAGLSIALNALIVLGAAVMIQAQPAEQMMGPVEPPDPSAPTPATVEPLLAGLPLTQKLAAGTIGFGLLIAAGAALIGQWRHLRDYPELGAAVAMGSLVFPFLTPFAVAAFGFNPMAQTPEAVTRTLLFTIPFIMTSIVIGLLYFLEPPRPRRISVIDKADGSEGEIEVQPDLLDWLGAFTMSRWWAIGALFWLFSIFFFTTMFTNGNGLGTGVIGSLGYWLEQQAVKRGNQPWYYYLIVQIPIYEFLPALLTMAAGVFGLGSRATRLLRSFSFGSPSDADGAAEQTDVETPVRFPVLGFLGYLTVMNLIAYTMAGEKMPWLTTHLTVPMILIGGWLVGRTIERVDWRGLGQGTRWASLIVLPLLIVALIRVIAPACALWPTNVLCNTIIPTSYQLGVFGGYTVEALAATGVWIGAAITLTAAAYAFFWLARGVRASDLGRILGLLVVGWLTLLTIRASWRASYIDYDNATEFLVYAHSAGAVREVMNQIEEISQRTTDGRFLRVAYDNRVSWPMSWYLRNYPNAIYYADQPSRGLIGDAPVILAGPGNWTKIDSLIGDRYYKFEYIRMWWPMEDYRGLTLEDIRNVLRDPALQRGIWEIFYNREFDAYADAVAPYRNGERPDFSLNRWPVAERMYFYVRKDTFAQVWDYGVAASEIAQAVDPYAARSRVIEPSATFGTGSLTNPHGVTVGPDNRIYVADTGNHRIAVFDSSGTLVDSFGQYGLAPAPGVLNEPWDVAVAEDGTVFVADTWNYRVVVFDEQGKYLRSWGMPGPNDLSNPFGLWGPRGITLDDQGTVYVADTGNKRIQTYTSDGSFLRQIGQGGTFDGQLDEPVGLAFGPDGLLYIADTWNQRVQVFDANGIFLRQWPVEGWFGQSNERPFLTIDGQGNVFVTDPDAYRVIVFNALGEYLYSFGDYSTITLVGGITLDDQGNLYVVDVTNGAVQRYDRAVLAAPAGG